MLRSFGTIVLLVTLLVGIPVRAVRGQEAVPTPRRISLVEALSRFEATNLQLAAARQEVAAAEARVVSAGSLRNPALSVAREQLSGGGTYHETVVALGQPIEIGGQRGLRRDAADRAAEAAEARLADQRMLLGFEVHRAYVRAAVAEADLALLAEATDVFRQVEQSGQARFASGDISQFDRNRLRVERATYETMLANASLALVDAGRELAMLVASDSAGTLGALFLPSERLSDLGAALIPASVDVALAAAAGRADVRAAEADVQATLATLSLQRRARIPDLTLTGGYKHQADGFQGIVLGVALPIPLWTRHRGEIAAANATYQSAVFARDAVLHRAQADIRQAWDTYRSIDGRMETLGRGLLSESAGLLETARVAYGEGEMSLLELMDAADAYRSARASVNQLLADYLVATYDLQRATGGLLPTSSR